MNGFLVTLACAMDDLPIGLYATREEALAAAQRQGTRLDPELDDVFCIDQSEAVCVRVVEFVAGRPVSSGMVKDFDE